jgi:DNA-binding protein HU-beta
MTKSDLIVRLTKRKDVPRELTKKAVTQLVDALFMELGDFFIRSRAGRKPAKFTYPRFGTFAKRRRNARTVRNPQNGDPIMIPSQVTVVFSPGQDLRGMLNDDSVGRRATGS